MYFGTVFLPPLSYICNNPSGVGVSSVATTIAAIACRSRWDIVMLAAHDDQVIGAHAVNAEEAGKASREAGKNRARHYIEGRGGARCIRKPLQLEQQSRPDAQALSINGTWRRMGQKERCFRLRQPAGSLPTRSSVWRRNGRRGRLDRDIDAIVICLFFLMVQRLDSFACHARFGLHRAGFGRANCAIG
jgi:hypothetical protein